MRTKPLTRSTQLARGNDANPVPQRAVMREVMLWTTRDGREIPVDDMTDAHIRNAIAALSRWRARLKKDPDGDGLRRTVADAISRFRRILRRRERAGGKRPATSRKLRKSRRLQASGRPLKPVART